MISAEWVSAIAAIISVPISIWAIYTAKKALKINNINLNNNQISNNQVHGSGTFMKIGNEK